MRFIAAFIEGFCTACYWLSPFILGAAAYAILHAR